MTAATPEQLAALTVPATLPGVVRVGTPVVATADVLYDDDSVMHSVGARGVVTSPARWGPGDWNSRSIAWRDIGEDGFEDHSEMAPHRLAACAVDLTDATGRAHVAWALDVRHGHVMTTTFGNTTIPYIVVWADREVCWSSRRTRFHHHAVLVPGLARLAPNNGIRLPDGSRWVDAEALRLVALHVLGGTPCPAS